MTKMLKFLIAILTLMGLGLVANVGNTGSIPAVHASGAKPTNCVNLAKKLKNGNDLNVKSLKGHGQGAPCFYAQGSKYLDFDISGDIDWWSPGCGCFVFINISDAKVGAYFNTQHPTFFRVRYGADIWVGNPNVEDMHKTYMLAQMGDHGCVGGCNDILVYTYSWTKKNLGKPSVWHNKNATTSTPVTTNVAQPVQCDGSQASVDNGCPSDDPFGN